MYIDNQVNHHRELQPSVTTRTDHADLPETSHAASLCSSTGEIFAITSEKGVCHCAAVLLKTHDDTEYI